VGSVLRGFPLLLTGEGSSQIARTDNRRIGGWGTARLPKSEIAVGPNKPTASGQAGGKGGTRPRKLVLTAPKVRGKGEPWHRRGKREVLTPPVSNRGVPSVQARPRPENGRTKTQLATQSQETQAGSTLAA